MKKFKLLLWALILVPSLTLVSCDDDDDVNYKPQLTANKWSFVGQSNNAEQILGAIEGLNKEENMGLLNELLYRLSFIPPFYNHTTANITVEFKDNNDFYLNNQHAGTYDLRNSMITIVYGDYTIKYRVSFSGNKLVLALDYDSALEIIQPYLNMNETSEVLQAAIKSALKAYTYEVEFVKVVE